jgi:phosphatidylserine decarboxylase
MHNQAYPHQYVERFSGEVRQERIFADRVVRALYAPVREHAPVLFKLLTGARSSQALAFFNYDLLLGARVLGNRRFLEDCRVDWSECLEPPERLDTARKVFERKIRYWDCRPLPDDPAAVVSPADARVIVGSFSETSALFLKEKFFDFAELFGPERPLWQQAFTGGDFAVFRLTPDKYHYNHVPVSGLVVDHYAIDGCHHSCNPDAVVSIATPYSKNRRVVTIINTDVPGGSQVGQVAMIEVVALMIGDICQAYSARRYENPQPVAVGLQMERGAPKSLYRPGSSTDVLIFQKDRIRFAEDLLANQRRQDVRSRFTRGFGQPLVETEVQVRSLLAHPRRPAASATPATLEGGQS